MNNRTHKIGNKDFNYRGSDAVVLLELGDNKFIGYTVHKEEFIVATKFYGASYGNTRYPITFDSLVNTLKELYPSNYEDLAYEAYEAFEELELQLVVKTMQDKRGA